MIPKECKRLAEVDFPIAAVSRHAAKEKSIRYGHPSTLHLWWARRPLASSRAVLLALLLPDPCDEHCPQEFRVQAKHALLAMRERPSDWDNALADDAGLRRVLLQFIADFANWENSANPDYLTAGQALVRAAHPEEPPLVVDPFAGGGSIPLEALRLGCDAFASDLNPVACLILKVMLEQIPRNGRALAGELRHAGAEIKAQAEQDLAELYPKDPDGATPIAYLWARTVRCEAPQCGAEIPLMSSMWLCRKPKKKWALRPKVKHFNHDAPRIEFEIFEPQKESEVTGGTVNRARATCLCCRSVLPAERVKNQLSTERGGADPIFDDSGNRLRGALMTAVVTVRPSQSGRQYRLPNYADYQAVRSAQKRVNDILNTSPPDADATHPPIPNETIEKDKRGNFWVVDYGVTKFSDLFTDRQKAALVTLQRGVLNSSVTTRDLLAITLNRVADGSASISRWLASGEEVKNVFSRQALPMVWDFGESNYLANASRSWNSAINSIARVIENAPQSTAYGTVECADAGSHPLPDQAAGVWFTDPPYYDAIAYSGLSDFFYVWLKRTLPHHSLIRNPFEPGSPVTPKQRELVVETRNGISGHHTKHFYEDGMVKAFTEGRRILNEDGIGSVYIRAQNYRRVGSSIIWTNPRRLDCDCVHGHSPPRVALSRKQ